MAEWREAKRSDLFEVGDRVEFIDEDSYDGAFIGERHRAEFGPPPYTVEDIENSAAPWLLDRAPHRQWLRVNGKLYSGAWFKPLRPAAVAVAA